MKKTYIVIIAIIVVAGAGGIAAWQIMKNKSDNQVATPSTNKASSMQQQYEGYKGEKYDQMFIAGMIVHHQGAIDMANLALANAQHQEIKDLATAIVTAQTSEITEMTAWQKSWDYPSTSKTDMQDHSAMAMETEMASMTDELKGKTGEDFDKAFLTQMIMHHQEAIDMSTPAKTNASHEEIKTLANSIISAQSDEISQMQNWQHQWGYVTQDSDSGHDMSGMHM